jgi:hypothetical protein
MRPHIPPEPIEPILLPRRPRAQNLKHPARNLKPNIRANDFPARDESRQLAAPGSRDSTPRGRSRRAAVHDVFEERGAVLPALAVHGGEFRSDAVEQGFCCEQVRVPATISFKNVELLGGAVFVVAAEGPGARALGRVGCGGVEGALGDSEVEVAED